MSELGRLLSEARAAKDLSLADVEKSTRIRQKYLDALEIGDFAKLPKGATARGFLRTYARFLGLNESETIALFVREGGEAGDEVPIAEVGKPRLLDYRPLEVELMDAQQRRGWVTWVVALLLALAVIAGVWWGLTQNPELITSIRNFRPLAAFGPRPTDSPAPTATPWVVTATPPTANTAVIPTSTSDLFPLPTPTVEPTVTATPRPTATPEVVTRLSLVLEVEQRSWVHIQVDDEPAIEETLDVQDNPTYVAERSITVRTGNAGGIRIILNDEDLGLMGGVGQVVERTWNVDQGQVVEASTPGAEGTSASETSSPTPSPTPSG